MKIKFLDLAKQYDQIKDHIDAAISDIINRSAFIGGEAVTEFEKDFAKFQDSGHCVGVGNGTDALEIAIESLGLPEGSEIIVPGNTFIASSEAVTRAGHKVVFCDIDEDTYNISTSDLESRITDKTKAILAVHLYGHPCDMRRIMEISNEYNLKVIEDCAQAHASTFKEKKVGSFGHISTFSFYPGKNLGAYGDGGAILTNDEALAIKSRMIANHGRVDKYDHKFEGRNSRLDGLQASILKVKLNYLEKWTAKRRKVASIYTEGLSKNNEIITPVEKKHCKHVYHLYVLRYSRRDDLIKFLNNNGISTGIHYPISLPKLEAYRHLTKDTDNMKCNSIDDQLLSLPMGDHLEDSEARYVVETINKYFQ
tara:strand:- start:630 stop:1730 length:1101 start_codon:yes stop_codon:yes gene_type:complete